MLLRHRTPGIESDPVNRSKGFEHLDGRALAVLRWLQANRIEFVLVGPVGEAIRGNADARGPVAIVPAPYGRNYERLSRALGAAHARLRIEPGAGAPTDPDTMAVKLTPDKLARDIRWALRCGEHDVDIEGRPHGVPRYQELLYEAGRFEVSPEMNVEVASPEDLATYDHIRRTGIAPEIKITRTAPVEERP
jgi:hypothetical protein